MIDEETLKKLAKWQEDLQNLSSSDYLTAIFGIISNYDFEIDKVIKSSQKNISYLNQLKLEKEYFFNNIVKKNDEQFQETCKQEQIKEKNNTLKEKEIIREYFRETGEKDF